MSLASEFPNDNPGLHHGVIWVCRETTGRAEPERIIDPQLVAILEADDDSTELIVEELEPLEAVSVEGEVASIAAPAMVVEEIVVAPIVEEIVAAPIAEVVVEEIVAAPIAEVVAEEEIVAAPIAEVVVEEEVVAAPIAEVVVEEVVAAPIAEVVVEEEIVAAPIAEVVVEEIVAAPIAEVVEEIASASIIEDVAPAVVAPAISEVVLCGSNPSDEEELPPSITPAFEEIAPTTVPIDSTALPPASDDPFTILVCTLADVAIGAGSPHIASILPGLLFDGRLPEPLDAAIADTLRAAGLMDPNGNEMTRSFVDTTRAWCEILRGTSDDFDACGAAMLDEWASDLLARLLNAPTKQTKLRQELRTRGVAAFGLAA